MSDVCFWHVARARDPASTLLLRDRETGERLKIATNNRKSSPSFDIAVVIQSMLKSVGIESDIDLVDWSTHMDRFLKGNCRMMVHSYSARLDPALSFEHFTGPKAEQPRKAWGYDEAIKLLSRASQMDNEADRKAIFDQLNQRMLGDVPLIMLFNPVEAWPRVPGFRVSSRGSRARGLGEVSIK